MSNVGKTLLKGHGLRCEGAVEFDSLGQRYDWNSDWLSGTPSLHAKCSCGALSPTNISRNAAKKWHREHKDSLR